MGMFGLRFLRSMIVRAPDDGGGSGGAAAGGAGASGGSGLAAAAAAAAGGNGVGAGGAGGVAASGGGQAAGGAAAGGSASEQGGAQAPSWARPDWLPEHLAGSTADEALEKTFKALDGFRQKAASRGEIPKDANGYTYTPPDELKGYFRENDPALGILAGLAHKIGISKPEYEALAGGFVSEAVKGGLIPAPFDANVELGRAAKGLNLPDTAEGKQSLAKIVTDTTAFAETFAKQLNLPEGPAAMLAALADTGDGIVALHAISSRLGARGPQAEGGQQTGAVSAADLKEMASDPRIDPTSGKFDQKVRDKYDEDYRRIYG